MIGLDSILPQPTTRKTPAKRARGIIPLLQLLVMDRRMGGGGDVQYDEEGSRHSSQYSEL